MKDKQTKIGILTFHKAKNYGAVMQAFALCRFLSKAGCCAELLNYNPFNDQSAWKTYYKKPWKLWKNVLIERDFEHFLQRYVPISAPYTPDGQWLHSTCIVGSDTVWNTEIVEDLLNDYLLGFAPSSANLISYAASMGGTGITGQYAALFENLLPRFAAISLRETIFVKQVRQIVPDKEVIDVCDPSLLLTAKEYEEAFPAISTPKMQRPYIAVFDLNGDENIKEIAKRLSQRLRLPLVNIHSRKVKYVDKNFVHVTPVDWLNLIRNAQFVCTNSFHGMMYSLVFQKNFVAVGAIQGARANNNNRVMDLFERIGLSQHYVTSVEQNFPMTVDYEQAASAIEQLRHKSQDFLMRNVL